MNDIEKIEYLQQRIDEVMDWFDFDKVHSVMTILKWYWGGEDGVPQIPEIQILRKHVRDYMKQTYYDLLNENKDFYAMASGGFVVECIKDEDGFIQFNVRFELANWNTGE